MLIALEKLCNQRKFLLEIEKVHSKLKDSCKRKDLQIKCYEKNCDCSTKRRNHFKKYPLKRRHHAGPRKKFFRKKKWKFLRRKQFKEKVCFVCRKPGHFAKNCPKKEKATKLLEQAQIHANNTPFLDLESLFSLDDDYSPQALVVMAYSTSEEDSDSDSFDASDLEIQTIYTSQPIIAPLTRPTPIAQVHILLETYSRPIPVIALFDTRVATTILQPKILLQNSSCPITRCSVQQMQRHS